MPFIKVLHFTLLHFNNIKLGLLYFTSLQLLIIKAVFEEPVYFKCIFEFRPLTLTHGRYTRVEREPVAGATRPARAWARLGQGVHAPATIASHHLR